MHHVLPGFKLSIQKIAERPSHLHKPCN